MFFQDGITTTGIRTNNFFGNNCTANRLTSTNLTSKNANVNGKVTIVNKITNDSFSSVGYNLAVLSSSAPNAPGVLNGGILSVAQGYEFAFIGTRGFAFEEMPKNYFGIFPDALNNGNYNPIVRANDHVLVSGMYDGSGNPGATGGIVLCPWSSTGSGLRMDPSGNINIAGILDVSGSIITNKYISYDYTTLPTLPTNPLTTLGGFLPFDVSGANINGVSTTPTRYTIGTIPSTNIVPGTYMFNISTSIVVDANPSNLLGQVGYICIGDTDVAQFTNNSQNTTTYTNINVSFPYRITSSSAITLKINLATSSGTSDVIVGSSTFNYISRIA